MLVQGIIARFKLPIFRETGSETGKLRLELSIAPTMVCCDVPPGKYLWKCCRVGKEVLILCRKSYVISQSDWPPSSVPAFPVTSHCTSSVLTGSSLAPSFAST